MKPDGSPTARALLALEVLQNTPGITAEKLGARLRVSERAARRYVAILREADIPIESVRGPHGGFRVGRGVRLPPLLFTPGEALGLVMAVLDGHHAVADTEDPVGSALAKLLGALPESVARQAETVRRTTAPARDRSAARPDPETATTLVEACDEHRAVRIRYRSEASEWEGLVEPWAIVVRHGRWYLLCFSERAQDQRAYRVDRVVSVEVLDLRCSPPADLDPVAALEAHLAVGWEYDVEVIIDAPLADIGWAVPPAIGKLEAIDAHTSRLTGSTSNPTWYAQQLAAIPAAYRILGGPEVRHEANRIGERLIAAAQ